jgi:hypothetical protein
LRHFFGKKYGQEETMDEARGRIGLTDSEIIDRFSRFGYRVTIEQIAFTTELVEDFIEARRKWLRAGRLRINEPGLLVIEEAQPRPGQRTRDMVIASFGSSRAVMGVEVKPSGASLPSGSALCKFAPTMHWTADTKPAPAHKISSEKPKRNFWNRIRGGDLPVGS